DRRRMMKPNKGGLAALAVVATTALLAAGCGGSAKAGSTGSGPKVKLSLVAYSTPQAAYKKIIKAFQQTPEGKNVTFTESSGGARWNVMGAYGGMLAEGNTEAQATAYLGELFKQHVPVQDDSARKSLQTFVGGKGDAMLAYENDAIFAQQNNQSLDYTVPKD